MCSPILSLLIVLSCLLTQPTEAFITLEHEPVQGEYFQPDVSVVEVLRARGFLADEFNFYTRDGYKINLVRGRNPLVNGGKSARAGTFPIMLIHGIVSSGATFLSSAGELTEPRDFSDRINQLDTIETTDQLVELMNGDKRSIKNLPVLALNFGYEVWFLNKRGSNKSRGRRGFENRTLLEALVSMPASFIANGFYPLAGLVPGRPHKFARNPPQKPQSQITPRPGADDHTTWSFLQDLALEGLTLGRTPGALVDFGRFKEQFIQTFDPEYWDYSLDQQAEHDLPQAIDFVTGKADCSRVHLVGLSSGGAQILLAAAIKPELARKVGAAVLWAPAVNMGSAKDVVYQLSQLVPFTQGYSGPIPFVFNHQQLSGLLQDLCSFKLAQRTICARLFDLILGYSGRQAPITPTLLATALTPTSYHEMVQLGQFAHTPQPCKLKFNNPKKNLERYGQLEPPCYDLARVQLKHISLYVGNEDILISPGDANTTRSQLSVPIKMVVVSGPEIYFNHAGSILHDQSDRLVLVPSLLDIRRAEISPGISKQAARCHRRRRRS